MCIRDRLRGVNGALCSVTCDSGSHHVTLGLELLELLFLDPVVGNSDNDDDADGDDDGCAINPAVGPAILVDTDRHGGHGSNAQDSHNGIIEALDDHITDGSDGSLQWNILSVSINSRVKKLKLNLEEYLSRARNLPQLAPKRQQGTPAQPLMHSRARKTP